MQKHRAFSRPLINGVAEATRQGYERSLQRISSIGDLRNRMAEAQRLKMEVRYRRDQFPWAGAFCNRADRIFMEALRETERLLQPVAA